MDKKYYTQGGSSRVTFVKAHIRNGKRVRAYSRRLSSGITSNYADKNIYGKRGVLLITNSGDLIETSGQHRGGSFKAFSFVKNGNPSGSGDFSTYYKGRGLYKKFKGNVTEYVRRKNAEHAQKKNEEDAIRARNNQDMYDIYHNRKKRKRK